MTRLRTLGLSLTGVLMGASALGAQDFTQYRDFTLGSPLATVVKATSVLPSDVRVVHQRPALVQELRWRPQRYMANPDSMLADPVREVVFTFFNDQLYLIAVDYDRQRTEGLTDADLVESLSSRYGQPLLLSKDQPTTGAPTAGDAVVARWGDAQSQLTLSRALYPTSIRLVLARPRIEALARTASIESVRQDDEDAPQREAARAAKLAADGQTALAKARTTNKPLFKP